MEKDLAQVTSVASVGGAFVCDNRGDVIVSSDPAVLATVTMNTIGREVGRVFVALDAAKSAGTRLEFCYDRWRLLAQDIGEAVLFVVCHPEADMSIVRMSADVIVAGWKGDPSAQKRLQRTRVERAALVKQSALDQGSMRSWSIIESTR
jgi:hypothetical protein